MESFIYNGKMSNLYNLYLELNPSNPEVQDGRMAEDGIDYIERNVFIYKKDEDGNIIPFNSYDLECLSSFLLTSGYSFLNIKDRNYYGMFYKKYNLWYKQAKEGFVELIFRLKPFIFSSIVQETLGVNNTKYSRKVECKSDIEMEFYPIILIENISRDFLSLSIENKSVKDNKLTFNGLIPIDRILIDTKEKYIKSYIDVSEDLYSKSNCNYIKLNKGANIIEVMGNKRATITIKYRNKFSIKEGDFFWVRK